MQTKVRALGRKSWKAALTLAAIALGGAAPQNGPSGIAFYQPPELGAGAHGELIWSRPLSGVPVLESAARNTLILYRTTALDGRDVAVSGTVAVPKGTPPAAGWPVITWAHGTTGDAPECAPSRDVPGGPMDTYLGLARGVLDDFVAHGYAVVQTDYEGQGTPGVHPYLVGTAEGRDTIDMLRAARALDPTIGSRYVVMGHSQGGHSALFAASLGPTWAPELTLLGVAAFAPASQLVPWIEGLVSQTDQYPGFGFAGLLVRGYASVYPDVRVNDVFVPSVAALEDQLATRCVLDLFARESWAGLIPAHAFVPHADVRPLLARIAENEPGTLHIDVPVLLVQSTTDEIVPAIASDLLDAQLCKGKNDVTYFVVAEATHNGVMDASLGTARDWLDDRFAAKPPSGNCAASVRAAPRD